MKSPAGFLSGIESVVRVCVCSGLWSVHNINDAQVHRQHLQMCVCDVAGDGLETLR